jgi:sirohydrochlorin ferrochelatase
VTGTSVTPIVLVAHGSRDPRAAATTRALVRLVGAARPGTPVRSAFLDHAVPRPGEALRALAAQGHDRAVVVPLLLTHAYHGRVDLPAVLAEARAGGLSLDALLADVLGPVDDTVPGPLLAALRQRLAATGVRPDAVVLAAAGTRDVAALSTVDEVAAALGAAEGVPCWPGYASASAPSPGEAVHALRALGHERIAVASYFLAPGRLYRAAVESAAFAGAVAMAEPLGACAALAALVWNRVDAVCADGTRRPALSGPGAGR